MQDLRDIFQKLRRDKTFPRLKVAQMLGRNVKNLRKLLLRKSHFPSIYMQIVSKYFLHVHSPIINVKCPENNNLSIHIIIKFHVKGHKNACKPNLIGV